MFRNHSLCLSSSDLQSVDLGCPCRLETRNLSIFTACSIGEIESVKKRITINPNSVNTCDSYGMSPLLYAAQNNHHKIVQLLLDNNGSPNIASSGATPLHRAAYSGAVESIQLLLTYAGVDINAQDESFGDHRTALHKAASQGHTRVVELLIAAGCDQNLLDAKGAKFHELTPKQVVRESRGSENACISNNVMKGGGSESVDKGVVGLLCTHCNNYKLAFIRKSSTTLICVTCARR